MDPRQRPPHRRKTQGGDTQHDYVLHFLQCNSRFFGVANGGMSATFCSRSNGKCELDKAPRFLVKRTGLMTGIGERGEALPKAPDDPSRTICSLFHFRLMALEQRSTVTTVTKVTAYGLPRA